MPTIRSRRRHETSNASLHRFIPRHSRWHESRTALSASQQGVPAWNPSPGNRSASTALFEERRAEARRRVFKGGILTFNNGYGALECVVRNLSAHGAKLAFGDTTAVPQRFELLVSDEAEPRAATVRWRSLTDAGISFDEEAA